MWRAIIYAFFVPKKKKHLHMPFVLVLYSRFLPEESHANTSNEELMESDSTSTDSYVFGSCECIVIALVGFI